jgi:hypothetical protein
MRLVNERKIHHQVCLSATGDLVGLKSLIEVTLHGQQAWSVWQRHLQPYNLLRIHRVNFDTYEARPAIVTKTELMPCCRENTTSMLPCVFCLLVRSPIAFITSS